MMTSKEELLNKLSECVLEMEDEEVVDVAEEYIEAGYPALDGIMEGLVDGMNKASELFMCFPCRGKCWNWRRKSAPGRTCLPDRRHTGNIRTC